MISRWASAVFSILLFLLAGVAQADEAGIRQAFAKKFPKVALESVAPTPFAGIYEIVFNGKIAYTDETLSFVMIGNLFDLRGSERRNLTQERDAEIAASALLQARPQAVKRVRGNGKRVLYTFEDPNCSFCRKLQKELLKVTDVTIYTFLWPIFPHSVEKSKAVWCAKDRGKAWDDLMTSGIEPQNDGKCANPLAANHELAQRFGIQGTPAVYLADGRQIGGYVAADQLERALLSASAK